MMNWKSSTQIVLLAALGGCGSILPAQSSPLGTKPGGDFASASAQDCAIFAAVAKSELLTKNGSVRLPARPEVGPKSSLVERHAAYAVRMKKAYAGTPAMQDLEPLARWIEREEIELSIVYPSLAKKERAAIVKERALAANGLQVNCDWAANSFTMESPKSDGQTFEPWLLFGRPHLARSGRLAFVDISFAYQPTFARQGQCAIERTVSGWRVSKCHYRLAS